MTTRPGTSPGKAKGEPPPSYTTLQRSPCNHKDKHNKNVCDAYKQQVGTVITGFIEKHYILRSKSLKNRLPLGRISLIIASFTLSPLH